MKKVSDKFIEEKGRRTICEVHREMWDLIHDEDYKLEDLKDLLNESYGYAKKMDAKLRQYAFNYDDDWWEVESKEVRKQKLETRRRKKWWE